MYLHSAQPDQWRQMAAHIQSGSSGGFLQLMRESPKCLLFVGTVGFSIIFRSRPSCVKCLEIIYVVIWGYTNNN